MLRTTARSDELSQASQIGFAMGKRTCACCGPLKADESVAAVTRASLAAVTISVKVKTKNAPADEAH